MKLFPGKGKRVLRLEDLPRADPLRIPQDFTDQTKSHEAAGYEEAGRAEDRGAMWFRSDDQYHYREDKGKLWRKPRK